MCAGRRETIGDPKNRSSRPCFRSGSEDSACRDHRRNDPAGSPAGSDGGGVCPGSGPEWSGI